MNIPDRIQHVAPQESYGLLSPESPIEWDMFDAMCAVAMDEFDFDVLFFSDASRGIGIPVRIVPQKSIGEYRVDFLVSCAIDDKRKIEIVVECDGHEFHERTKEQASHDKTRDRFMQRLGYRTFHYTGSDIHCRANACAREVMGTVRDWQKEQTTEGVA